MIPASPTDFDNWSPLTPQQVGALFQAFSGPWWMAGGWAIDLFIGRQTRPHEDIDIAVLRRDQHAVHDALPGWLLYAVDPPGTLRPWRRTETLPLAVNNIWCRPWPGEPWGLQVLLEDTNGDRWSYRRDARITRPVASLGEERDGIPAISPKVQLLYKSKGLRPRDEHDFAHALPLLDQAQRDWLAGALAITQAGHRWLPLLREDHHP
ncbi:MAG: amino acid transporter [Chloroflexota bacterium]|nr:amino acid transporter [Chloroflexota bacterium]